ncbi:MAG TPA: ATP-binding protein [Solirubrobacterales bacterium]|nr:ATP-binding protein [Solirubrobacterales bacterium]
MRPPRLGLLTIVVIGGALLLAIVIGSRLVTIDALNTLEKSNDSLIESSESLRLANELEQRVIDLETGQRGYLITGDRSFLQPRDDALREIPQLERRLLAEETVSAEDEVLLGRLFRQIDRYANGYQARTLALAEEDLVAARAVVTTEVGKRQVDAMRGSFDDFIRRQSAEEQQSRDEAAASSSRAETIAIVSLATVPLLLVLALVWAARGVVAPVRRFAEAARRVSHGDLEARVPERGAGEVRDLAVGFNTMAESLREGRDEMENQNAELEAQQEELERTVEELAEEKARVEEFHAFVSAMSAQAGLEDLARFLLADTARYAGAEAAALYLREDGSGEATLAHAIGFDRGALPEVVHPGSGLAGRALGGEEEVASEHSPQAGGPAVPSLAGATPVRHELHLAIGNDPAIGVVSLGRLADVPFSPAVRDGLRRRTQPAAVALSRALANERTDRTAKLNQAVLETANDAYMATDEEGLLISWTPHAEEMFGYPAAEALGRPQEDLVVPEQREALAGAREALIEAGERGEPMRFEATALDRQGRRFIIEVSAAAIHSRAGWTLSAFVRDIDERVRRGRERQAAEAVSRALAEAAPGEDVLPRVVDSLTEAMDWRGGSLWEWETGARALRCIHVFDRDDARLAEAAELTRRATLDTATRPDYDVDLRALESNEPLWEPLPADSGDERVRALAAAGVRATLALPIKAGEEPLGVLRFLLESERPPNPGALEAVEGIMELIVQVIGRRRAEEEAERLKNEFFALVSHELRTPLTSIIGYLDIVREEEAGEINEQQGRYLGVIDRNARRLMRLVGDLLFVAQVEAGTLSLERGEVDLAAVGADSVEAARPRADSQGVLLALDAEPLELHGADHDRLGQLVDNLVSNALKFTPEGGRIGVRIARQGSDALIEVSDTGTGIEADELEHLFERFYRAQAATDAAVPGIGLGLSICQAIAAGHGGSISVDSEVGVGTTFSVRLPMRQPAVKQPAGS